MLTFYFTKKYRSNKVNLYGRYCKQKLKNCLIIQNFSQFYFCHNVIIEKIPLNSCAMI